LAVGVGPPLLDFLLPGFRTFSFFLTIEHGIQLGWIVMVVVSVAVTVTVMAVGVAREKRIV